MDLGSLFVILALLIIVVGFIARPIIEKRGNSVSDNYRHLSELQAKRDQILMVLQELDMDHDMGKILTEDYEAQRPGLVTRGAQILREIDQLGGLDSAHVISNGQKEREVDVMIEEEILRRRKSLRDESVEFCTQCGNPLQVGDQFCTSCGAKVELAETEA